MLWLAEHPAPQRPPLRLLFTVDEEVGLGGARDLDPACVDGVRYLINTDGFHWGRIVIGSAGGVREHFTRALTHSNAPNCPTDALIDSKSAACAAVIRGLISARPAPMH